MFKKKIIIKIFKFGGFIINKQICWDIYKQGSFEEAPLPSPITTHVHCFINITFQGSIWKPTHLHVVFFFFLFLFLFFPHKSYGSISFFFSFPFFFLTNILVADLSSFSSNSDRIRPNWGCFSQFLSQLRRISAQIGPNRLELARIGDEKKNIYIYIYTC